jgi:hypothetical protein
MKGKAKLVDGEVEVTYRVPLAVEGPPPRRPAAEPGPELSEKEKATHSPGFTAVNWFGTVYQFSRMQGRVVAMLWHAWKDGDGDGAIHQDVLLQDADSDQQRLRDLFNKGDHPAWGTMIIAALDKGGQRGCYTLNVPDRPGA